MRRCCWSMLRGPWTCITCLFSKCLSLCKKSYFKIIFKQNIYQTQTKSEIFHSFRNICQICCTCVCLCQKMTNFAFSMTHIYPPVGSMGLPWLGYTITNATLSFLLLILTMKAWDEPRLVVNSTVHTHGSNPLTKSTNEYNWCYMALPSACIVSKPDCHI